MSDAMQLYRRFLAGKPGTCIFTGKDGCHASATEDEIEATFGSRHDTHNFVWLDRKPGEVGPEGVGFVSDDHIDALLADHRIAFAYSDKGGTHGENREGVKAAFLLGADRMSRILALPVDAGKCVAGRRHRHPSPRPASARRKACQGRAGPACTTGRNNDPAGLDYRGWRSARPPRRPLKLAYYADSEFKGLFDQA